MPQSLVLLAQAQKVLRALIICLCTGRPAEFSRTVPGQLGCCTKAFGKQELKFYKRDFDSMHYACSLLYEVKRC